MRVSSVSGRANRRLRVTVLSSQTIVCARRLCLIAGGKTRNAAFGTDAFLVALLENGLCSPDDVAGHFVRLMRWRYRFLLPPADILVRLAIAHSTKPPGAPLAEVARYIHDCMRDPGLFAGPEPTDPPMPLAARLGNAWARVITEFVMQLWLEESVTAEVATAFSTWAFDEALPGPSSNLHPFVRQRLGGVYATSSTRDSPLCRPRCEG